MKNEFQILDVTLAHYLYKQQPNPKLVIGIDIDQRLVKNAIENIHRVINTESTIEILEQKDEFMEEDEGSHTKLIELLSKTKNLPKSLQLSL